MNERHRLNFVEDNLTDFVEDMVCRYAVEIKITQNYHLYGLKHRKYRNIINYQEYCKSLYFILVCTKL